MSMFEADLDAFRVWWRTGATKPRRQRTAEEYIRQIRQWHAWEAQRNPIPPSTPTMRGARAYVAEVVDRSAWAAFGATKALKAWSKFLAEEAGHEDPLAALPYRKEPETSRTPVATEADIDALLATCSGDSLEDVRDRAILCLVRATGMRRGELVKMRWSDVDWTERTVHLPNDSAKNGKGRTVAFDTETRLALRRYVHRLDQFTQCRVLHRQPAREIICLTLRREGDKRGRSDHRSCPGWGAARRLERRPCAASRRAIHQGERDARSRQVPPQLVAADEPRRCRDGRVSRARPPAVRSSKPARRRTPTSAIVVTARGRSIGVNEFLDDAVAEVIGGLSRRSALVLVACVAVSSLCGWLVAAAIPARAPRTPSRQIDPS